MGQNRGEHRRIFRAFSNGSELIVRFADRTDISIPVASLVPPGTRSASWTEIDVAPFDIRIKAEPNTIEIPWSRLRYLTHPEYNAHIDSMGMNASQKIGLIIRSLREKRKLSSKEVAERAGISAQSLSRIENGRHDVVFTTLQRILGAMGCTLHDSSSRSIPECRGVTGEAPLNVHLVQTRH